MKTVLFTGAGFSAVAGLPTMEQFGGAFRSIFPKGDILSDPPAWLGRAGSEECRLVSQVFHRTHSLGVSEELSANLEWVFAHLDMLITLWPDACAHGAWPPPPGSGRDDALDERKTLRDYREALRIVVHKVLRDPVAPVGVESTLARFVGQLSPDTIITTNYDRVAERVLDSVGLRWHHVATEQQSPHNIVNICKLHGDTLWKEEGQGVWGVPSLHERGRGAQQGESARDDGWWHGVQEIVLPTWVREAPRPGLKRIWAEALSAIVDCERLAIAGFGLPATDQHIAQFLTASLCLAQRIGDHILKDITIINPAVDAISRLLNVVPKGLRPKVKVHPVTLEEFVAQ
jgi:hypothetical protein